MFPWRGTGDFAPRARDGESPPFGRRGLFLALTGGWDSAIIMAEILPARKGEHLLRLPPVRIPVLGPAHKPVHRDIVIVRNPE